MNNRKLSVHVEHELLLKFETAGLDDALAQKVIESKDNRLAMEFVNSLKSKQTLGESEVQALMGKKNFFGSLEWMKFFGNKFSLANIPEIPWSQTELENPGIDQKHFLFLGLDLLDGKSLSLPAWHKIYHGENHPKFYWEWYLTHKFAQIPCELRWYLMPIGILKGSVNLSYDRQIALLPDKYEVPNASARVTANILYYLLNKKYLDTDFWARTSDKSDGGNRVLVRGHSDNGIGVDHWSGNALDFVGLGASRKF